MLCKWKSSRSFPSKQGEQRRSQYKTLHKHWTLNTQCTLQAHLALYKTLFTTHYTLYTTYYTLLNVHVHIVQCILHNIHTFHCILKTTYSTSHNAHYTQQTVHWYDENRQSTILHTKHSATFDGRLRRGATPGVGWSRYHRETDCLELSANQCFPISRGQCKGRYQQETYCLHYVFSTTRYSLPHPSQIYSIPSLFQHHSATSIWDNFVPIEIRTKQRKRLCQVDLLMSSEKREPLEL